MQDTLMAGTLLAEVAPILDLDALVQHADDQGTSWDIVFDENLLVEAFHDAVSEKLVLSANLGSPTEANAARMHRLLLQYNYLWRDTSGTRMALEEPGGSVVMLYDVPLTGLDGVLLRNILQNFAAAARAWAIMIADSPSPEGSNEAEAADGSSLDPAFFVRV